MKKTPEIKNAESFTTRMTKKERMSWRKSNREQIQAITSFMNNPPEDLSDDDYLKGVLKLAKEYCDFYSKIIGPVEQPHIFGLVFVYASDGVLTREANSAGGENAADAMAGGLFFLWLSNILPNLMPLLSRVSNNKNGNNEKALTEIEEILISSLMTQSDRDSAQKDASICEFLHERSVLVFDMINEFVDESFLEALNLQHLPSLRNEELCAVKEQFLKHVDKKCEERNTDD